MEQIRNQFQKFFRQTDRDWQIFSAKLERQAFPKKQLLLKAGQTENYLSFLETGIVRFFLPKEDMDLTFDFAFENNFFSGYSSFLTRTPAVCHIETLTETVLWRISYEALQTVYRDTEAGDKIGRHAGEALFLKKAKRELSLLNETAEQRYLNLFTEQPRLLRQIPLKYIASYIGITPQALSRIRKRIS